MKRLIRDILAAGLVLWGGWLAIPRQGHSFETLLMSCTAESGAVIRLFEGNGGATWG